MPEPSRADPASKQVRLDAIGTQVLTCRRCALHRTRTLGVPGVGPATARLMAIGEAPGEREDKEGKPFVGAAGR
ncbi:MAG: uracil-DNA glycosylase family protein, partial [Candidatus Dormibacteria bacterium]